MAVVCVVQADHILISCKKNIYYFSCKVCIDKKNFHKNLKTQTIHGENAIHAIKM
jgi:hypothetical protein